MGKRTGTSTARLQFQHLHDVWVAALGTFMLVWETVVDDKAQNILIAAGLACLGIPATGVLQKRAAARASSQEAQ